MKKEISRRSFLKTGAFAALGMAVAPNALLGKETGVPFAQNDDFPTPKNNEIEVEEGITIYGYVGTSDGPLAGVAVSDGVEVVLTDEKGIYQIASKKEYGTVFISVPGGYEVGSNGILPLHYSILRNLPTHKERADFRLIPKAGQDAFKLFVLGDMHLMKNNRNAPMQFKMFTDELSSYIAAHKDETMYALTLGDMTWDEFWYGKNNIFFPEYLDIMNEAFPSLQVFHTMGNHDNDYKTDNDLDAEKPYTQYIAPTHYSFNIGKIHFIVLDNIDCTPYNGTKKHSYLETITEKQFKWLKKDLSLIDKSTPIILSTHAPLFRPEGATLHTVPSPDTLKFLIHKPEKRGENVQELLNIIKDYRVHVITGHSHLMFNVTPDDDVVNGMNLYEHNAGAICGTWWYSEWLTPGVNIAKDGAPSGYGVWDINGEDIKYRFKGYGIGEDIQFRTYDLNNVCFTMDDVPNLDKTNEKLVKGWKKYCDAYPMNRDNEVLINIWNWNRYWKLEVVDDKGRRLAPSPVFTYDPLHILAHTLPSFNKEGRKSYPYDTTNRWTHMFKVNAGSPRTNLTITVTDEYGNVYTEKMVRPKAFNASVYARPNV